MVFTTMKKERILFYYRKGFRAPTIKKKLAEEGYSASREGIHKFLCLFRQTGCLNRREGSGRPSKITGDIKRIVEAQMQLDDETTAHQLHGLLIERGYQISLRTVLRCRSALGWTFRGSAYCQLIRYQTFVCFVVMCTIMMICIFKGGQQAETVGMGSEVSSRRVFGCHLH